MVAVSLPLQDTIFDGWMENVTTRCQHKHNVYKGRVKHIQYIFLMGFYFYLCFALIHPCHFSASNIFSQHKSNVAVRYLLYVHANINTCVLRMSSCSKLQLRLLTLNLTLSQLHAWTAHVCCCYYYSTYSNRTLLTIHVLYTVCIIQ